MTDNIDWLRAWQYNAPPKAEPPTKAPDTTELDAELRTAVFEKQLQRNVDQLNSDWEEPPRTLSRPIGVLFAILIVIIVIVFSGSDRISQIIPRNVQTAEPETMCLHCTSNVPKNESKVKPTIKLATLTPQLPPNLIQNDWSNLFGPPEPMVIVPSRPEQPRQPAETKVAFVMKGGTLFVPVRINNTISVDFMLDSGAADVNLSDDVYLALVRNGTITRADMRGERDYVLADDRISRSKTFIIKSLKLGDITIANVLGTIGGRKPLLGQSFLTHFKSWSIDNAENVIVLKRRWEHDT